MRAASGCFIANLMEERMWKHGKDFLSWLVILREEQHDAEQNKTNGSDCYR